MGQVLFNRTLDIRSFEKAMKESDIDFKCIQKRPPLYEVAADNEETVVGLSLSHRFNIVELVEPEKEKEILRRAKKEDLRFRRLEVGRIVIHVQDQEAFRQLERKFRSKAERLREAYSDPALGGWTVGEFMEALMERDEGLPEKWERLKQKRNEIRKAVN